MSQEMINKPITQKLIKFRSMSYVAMGSNVTSSIGTPRETLLSACVKLEKTGLVIRAKSRIYRTPAFPPGNGADYANAVIEVGHNCTTERLLEILHETENEMGRVRKTRWGARILDLDLLATGQDILPSVEKVQEWMDLTLERQRELAPDTLLLPHPRLHERAFVLVPLAEIAPSWRHPILGQTVEGMCAALAPADLASVVPYDEAG